MNTVILSVILFYLLPIFIGRPLVRFFIHKNPVYPFISYFLTGAVLLYVFAFIGFFLSNLSGLSLPGSLILQITAGVLSFILLPLNFFLSREDFKIRKYILPFTGSFILAAIVYFIWQFNSPYPFNWDLFEHQTLVNTILKGDISLIPSHLSDTFGFDGYSTLFHTLVSYSQSIVSSPVLSYWKTIGFVHFAIVIFASYLFGKAVTNNKEIAVLMTILTAFIFDSTISFTSLFFIPQTFTAVVWILLISQLLKSVREEKSIKFSLIILGSVFILFSHYIVGTVASALYLGLYLFNRYQDKISKKVSSIRLIEIAGILSLVAVIFSPSLPFGFLNGGEASAFTLSLSDKYLAMRQAYGYLMLLTLPVGIWAAIKTQKKALIYSSALLLLLSTVVLLGLPYVMKFYVLTGFFVTLFMGIGLSFLFSRIKNPIFKAFSYLALIIFLGIIFVSNALIWKGILHYQSETTHISPNEVSAAKYIKENYKDGSALLISDPATQNILETLSGVNSQGGAYMSTSSRNKLTNAGISNNPAETISELYKINDKIVQTGSSKRLLVLSGRYFIWQKASQKDKLAFNYNVWYPADLTLEDIGQINSLLLSSKKFKLVYQNSTLAVVEVSR